MQINPCGRPLSRTFSLKRKMTIPRGQPLRFHARTLFCPMIYVYIPKSEYLHLILGLRKTVVISYFVLG